MTTRIAIIGGGISGLHAASLLTARGMPCTLFESRDRLGGRGLSVAHDTGNPAAPLAHVDLGPAWFWPDAQPRITALVRELGVPVFPQYASGAMRVERFRLEAAQSFVPDEGMVPDALRFQDGVQSLVAALARSLPPTTIRLSTAITSIADDSKSGCLLHAAAGEIFTAHHVIVAVPPRVAAHQLSFTPALRDAIVHEMRATPTWMAPHAKMLAVYDTPFWRADGFSGMASSFVGPLQEIHDASPVSGVGALFGFMGIGAGARRTKGEAGLRERVLAQLVRLFGARAASPRAVYFKDWAADPDTATADDLEPSPTPHGPGTPELSSGLWEGRLLFAGAEVAQHHPGYMEGALLAAERAVAQIEQSVHDSR